MPAQAGIQWHDSAFNLRYMPTLYSRPKALTRRLGVPLDSRGAATRLRGNDEVAVDLNDRFAEHRPSLQGTKQPPKRKLPNYTNTNPPLHKPLDTKGKILANSTKAGFAVLYSWKLNPGFESQFINSWSSVTQALLALGSFGSRLHKGQDGIWYAYAQWPTAAARDVAFNLIGDSNDTAMMTEAILESFPPILMEPIADYLVLPAQT